MRKAKVISLLLSLSLMVSLVMPSTFVMPTYAAVTEPESDQMVLNKTAVKDEGSDTYTITLEAYATGKTTMTNVEEKVPTDIILVLDQSGSMRWTFSTDSYSFSLYSKKYNWEYYNYSENGDLYYKIGDNYVPVTVEENHIDEYTYYYKDESGIKQNIGTSRGWWTKPSFSFYKKVYLTRLEALKNAVTGFADDVKQRAEEDKLNHRVAVVGFASGKSDFTNTEVFVGADQYTYGKNAKKQYSKALQDMSTTPGYNNVCASIAKLDSDGATYPQYGLEMAKEIFKQDSTTGTRNRVVVLFTDGTPGQNGYDPKVADSAITVAKELKNANVTVYSVGIFAGADARSSGDKNGSSEAEKANWFMQNVSSNNGVPPVKDSYYLSAADAETLNTIFKNISDRIPTSGTSVELKAESVIKDTISPYFQIPEDAAKANVTIKTCEYQGTNNGKISWGSAVPESGVTYTFADDNNDGNKEIKVTGFDFSDNWCGMEEDKDGNKTPHGKKLQISFKVEAKPDFLGGNGVPTNGPAGVSKDENDAKENNFLYEFPEKPEVDVAIKDIQISAPEKNVYLLQGIPGKEIKSGITAKVGNVDLNLGAGAPNYGLEEWQKEFVTIDVKIKAEDGTEISDNLAGLSDDSKYTVSITVSPKKTEGAAKASTNNGEGKINVFKPELTFKDSEAYYGEKVTEDFSSSNKSGESWKHGEGENVVKDDDDGITMIGNRPVLDIGYTPNDGMLDVKNDVKYYTKKDVPVKATVKIGAVDVTENTGFLHECDSNNCDWQNPTTKGDPAFKIHVKTCQLTITKNGGAVGEPYVFTVKRNGNDYSEVTVGANESATIYELPVGTYTIEEDTGWSWRYASNRTGSATLSAPTEENSQSYMGTITCTNTKTNNKWLNGFSSVVQNIYHRENN